MRPDGRKNNEPRTISFERDFTKMADGSVLVSFGNTRVLCTASVETDVPRWLKDSGKGWVTAEYSMLPGSSPERIRRRSSGRDKEIQRLIGRSLRSVCDLEDIPGVQVTVDCDVLQADGGTRTASICGGFVALHDALTRAKDRGAISIHPLDDHCAAISVGIVNGECLLDLPYVEDSIAEVDMNIVMAGEDKLIEVQGTAEEAMFSRAQLNEMLDLAGEGIAQIIELQKKTLAEPPVAHNGK